MVLLRWDADIISVVMLAIIATDIAIDTLMLALATSRLQPHAFMPIQWVLNMRI